MTVVSIADIGTGIVTGLLSVGNVIVNSCGVQFIKAAFVGTAKYTTRQEIRTMKVVINRQHGGFSLSHIAIMRYAELCGFKLFWWLDDIAKKHCPNHSPDKAFLVHYSRIPIQDESDYKRQGKEAEAAYFSPGSIARNDPNLIRAVEELGTKANGKCATLKIVEIPDDVNWQIEEYDGLEWVSEEHRTWQ